MIRIAAVVAVVALVCVGAYFILPGPEPEPETVTVEFDSVLNHKLETIEKGATIDEPAMPVPDGHVIIGWYIGDTEDWFDFGTPVTSDIILRAILAKTSVDFDPGVQSHLVEFKYNIPQADMSYCMVNHMDRAVYPEIQIIPGYRFDGWYDSGTYTHLMNTEVPIVERTTVYGHYTVDSDPVSTFRLSIHLGEYGSVSDHVLDRTFNSGSIVDSAVVQSMFIGGNTDKNIGIGSDVRTYKLVGFYRDPSFNNPATIPFQMNQDVHLYAKYAEQVSVTFDCANGNIDGDSRYTRDVFLGVEIDHTDVPIPVRTGFEFMGWYNGDVKVFDPSSDDGLLITGKVTLTAKWKSSTWIEYNPQYITPEEPVLLFKYTENGKRYYIYYTGSVKDYILSMNKPYQNLGGTTVVDLEMDMYFGSVSNTTSNSYTKGSSNETYINTSPSSSTLGVVSNSFGCLGSISSLVSLIPKVNVGFAVVGGLCDIAGGIMGIVDSADQSGNTATVNKAWEEYTTTNSIQHTQGEANARLNGVLQGLDFVEYNHWVTKAIIGVIDYYQCDVYDVSSGGERYLETVVHTICDPYDCQNLTAPTSQSFTNPDVKSQIVVNRIVNGNATPVVNLDVTDRITFYDGDEIKHVGVGDKIYTPEISENGKVLKWSKVKPSEMTSRSDLVDVRSDFNGSYVYWSECNTQKLYALWLDAGIADYKLIFNTQEFSDIQQDTSGRYALMKDLSFNGNRTSLPEFRGVFDGNGHTIRYSYDGSPTYRYGTEGTYGLFYKVNGTIRNLNVDVNLKISTGEGEKWNTITNVGGIVGVLDGGTVSDCIVNGSITTYREKHNHQQIVVGGIAGLSVGDSTISLCEVGATLDSDGAGAFCGGIVGRIWAGNTTVSECLVTGKIYAWGSTWTFYLNNTDQLFGLAAYVGDSGCTTTGILYGCGNNYDANHRVRHDANAGGIVGATDGNATVHILKCHVASERVTAGGTHSAMDCGSIVGRNYSGNVYISDCCTASGILYENNDGKQDDRVMDGGDKYVSNNSTSSILDVINKYRNPQN